MLEGLQWCFYTRFNYVASACPGFNFCAPPNTFCAQARYLVMVRPILLQFLQLFATHMSKSTVIYIVFANAAYFLQMLHMFRQCYIFFANATYFSPMLHNYSWLSMIMYDYAYSCIVMHNYAWLCMIMHNYASLCIIMHDYW